MKITIEIDATPQEVREFFGLPDVRPLQEKMLSEIQRSVSEGTSGLDPLSLMRPLFPGQMQSLDALQKAFWESFSNSQQSTTTKDDTKSTTRRGTKS